MLSVLHLTVALAAMGRTPCAAMCPCVVPPGVDRRSAPVMVPPARHLAAAVFLGRVIQIDTLARDSIWIPSDTAAYRRLHVLPRAVRYTFEVSRTWKGSGKPRMRVVSPDVSTSCGRAYELHSRYLVYAERERSKRWSDDQLMTYSCSRVRGETDAADDLRLLGPGRPPRP